MDDLSTPWRKALHGLRHTSWSVCVLLLTFRKHVRYRKPPFGALAPGSSHSRGAACEIVRLSMSPLDQYHFELYDMNKRSTPQNLVDNVAQIISVVSLTTLVLVLSDTHPSS